MTSIIISNCLTGLDANTRKTRYDLLILRALCLLVCSPIYVPHSFFTLLDLLVENKGVWDFAGDGWVHRLVLHQSDPAPTSDTSEEWQTGTGVGSSSHRHQASSTSSNSSSSSSSSRGEVSVKIVEITDPRSHAAHRPRTAPLSDQQEEMAVNRYFRTNDTYILMKTRYLFIDYNTNYCDRNFTSPYLRLIIFCSVITHLGNLRMRRNIIHVW